MKNIKVIDSKGPLRLLKNTGRDRFTVVRVRGESPFQDVRSVVPGDMPADGGVWVARYTKKGIEYVASWYSYSWARRVFNRALTPR